jgi:hypothetical protein
MTMTVARRNRRWTPELRDKLYSDVAEYTNKGFNRKAAFEYLGPQWGLTSKGMSTAYYKRNRTKAVKSVAPVSSLKNANTVEDAINILKNLGVKVTLSF